MLVITMVLCTWYVSHRIDGVFKGIQSIDVKQDQIILLVSPEYPMVKEIVPIFEEENGIKIIRRSDKIIINKK